MFPVRVSVSVMGVGVPSRAVGDYDVVRGTKNGFWKIEVMAKNNRTTARASCSFKGSSRRITITAGPDLSKLSGWHTITCVDDNKQVQLFVDGNLAKSQSGSTGPINNTGPLLIGAKDTNGGDQFSGYAKDVDVTVG